MGVIKSSRTLFFYYLAQVTQKANSRNCFVGG